MKRYDVGVVGAGFAGSAAALFLAERGHRVTLYEEAAVPAPVGAGILMQPSGLSVLADLGLLNAALARGSRIDALECRTPSGRSVLDLRYQDLDRSLFGVGMHRGALLELLHQPLAGYGVRLQCGASVRDVRRRARSIEPLSVSGVALGEHELLVVADGARSALRERVPGASAVGYPWGARWFVARDQSGVFAGKLWQIADGTETLLGFLPCGLGPRREPGAVEQALTSVFWSVPVAAFERSDFDLERWKERVLSLEPRAAALLAQIDEPGRLLPASYFDVRLPCFDAERLVFIGDAAHATSPQLGQGTNLALEDARALASWVSAGGELQAALAGFSHERCAHASYYQWASRGLTPFFQSRKSGLSELRDLVLGPLCRFPPTRRMMLATLAGMQRGFLGGTQPLGPIRARLGRISR